jgi:hypothetical protein
MKGPKPATSQYARSKSAYLVTVSNQSPIARDLFIEQKEAEIERFRSDLGALTMERAEVQPIMNGLEPRWRQ